MSKANIAYKYRLYPTTEQKLLFAKTFGCCRKVYNLMLSDKISYYRETGKSLMTTPAMYKEEHPYLKEVDSLALANEQLHLQTAYKNFFRDKNIGFPKFKSAKKSKKSYTTNHVSGNIKLFENAIKLPKLGMVRARIHRLPKEDYRLKSVTVTNTPGGEYYASVLFEYEETITPVEVVTHIGLDYASNGLFVSSEGECCNMPHFYRMSQKKLAKEQKKLSRMAKGSANYQKQKRKVAKLHSKIANQREDFLHKKENEITNRYDLISVEDLDMKRISRSLHLGKATLDNGYGLFVHMLLYKQKNKGHHLIKVDRQFPSSQLCQCGYQNPVTKDLSVRTVTCPVCGRTYDRDENAAINIDNEGLRMFLTS